MLYVCGTDLDYDTWAALGNTGWDYNSILPFMKKSEDNTDASTVLYKNGQYHGTGGPLTISNYGSTDSYIQVLKDAFNQTGYKFLRDFNSQEYNGLVELQGTLKGRERCSAARAYLLPFKSRPNLTVMKGSMVEKILFSGTKASGVNVVTKNADCLNIKLYATKEVIIAAGALGSPKILLKSGIGRAGDLTPFGIPQVKNLAVGENFQDHVKSVHFIKINPNATAQTILDIAAQASEYLGARTGPFSNLNIMNYNGFINTMDPNAKYPDAHYIFYRFAKSQEYLTQILSNLGYKDSIIKQINATNSQYEIIMVFNHLPNPTSKGTVKLRSNSTWDYPKTVTNFLSSTSDVDNMLRGIVKLEQLVQTPAFQNNYAELIKFDIPECNSLAYPSDAYRRCYMKYFTASGWHQSGTCKMGPASDNNAVVDERLRVYGIDGLRVADASIMPNVVTTNTQCAVYAIGEKAAQMIIEDNA
jgi:choline dehydrogenase